jgi:hypothetical protein
VAVKSLLRFATRIGHMPFSAGAAVRSPPPVNVLDERSILSEEQVVRLIALEPPRPCFAAGSLSRRAAKPPLILLDYQVPLNQRVQGNLPHSAQRGRTRLPAAPKISRSEKIATDLPGGSWFF